MLAMKPFEQRRADCDPQWIGLATWLLAPLASIIWGVRQRSWSLAIAPTAVSGVIIAVMIGPEKMPPYKKYSAQFVGGAVAYVISRELKRKASVLNKVGSDLGPSKRNHEEVDALRADRSIEKEEHSHLDQLPQPYGQKYVPLEEGKVMPDKGQKSKDESLNKLGDSDKPSEDLPTHVPTVPSPRRQVNKNWARKFEDQWLIQKDEDFTESVESAPQASSANWSRRLASKAKEEKPLREEAAWEAWYGEKLPPRDPQNSSQEPQQIDLESTRANENEGPPRAWEIAKAKALGVEPKVEPVQAGDIFENEAVQEMASVEPTPKPTETFQAMADSQPTEPPANAETLEEALIRLKEWSEKGLISEDEYDQLRKKQLGLS